jgi:hypothetical protein
MDQNQTYGPQEVCDAAGVARATFHSWVARKYLPLPPAPGAGRERRFSVRDAVRIAVVVELTRLGVSIGIAGRISGNITDRHIERENEITWALIMASSAAYPARASEPAWPGFAIHQLRAPADVEEVIYRIVPGGKASSYVMVDLTAVAKRTVAALDNPEALRVKRSYPSP